MSTHDIRSWRRIIIVAVAIFALYQFGLGLLSSLGSFLMLILLAWLLAIAMEPAVHWFEARGFRRGLGAGVVLLSIVAFLAVFLATFGGLMFTQLSDAVSSAPAVVTNIIDWLNNNFDLKLNPDEIIKAMKLDTSSLTPLVTNLAGGLLSMVSSLLTLLFDFLTILVFAFYLSAESPKVKRGIASFLKPHRQHIFVNVWDIAVSKTGGFVMSRVILALISAVAHTVFFWAIGVPYWLPMGLFAGITAQFIPTIGTYLGIAVPVLFSVGHEALDAVWIIAFATVYQQIENYVLSPRVSRATMDIHPAVALAAVLIGAAIFGPIGAIIGIPIVAGIISVVDTYAHRFEVIPDLAPDDYSENE